LARNLAGQNALTVITNNIHILEELAKSPQIETIILGGTLKHQEMCTVGPMVTQSLSVLSVDKCFLSTAGFDPHMGVTDLDMREVEVDHP
jgi:DeoR/GlpR family transcriptional regulator of sugar metabolism